MSAALSLSPKLTPLSAITQQTLLQKVRPLLEQHGRTYQKIGRVLARPAQAGEVIHTITADGLETTNTAKPGDWLVQNPTHAAEQYLVPSDAFEQRYQYLRPASNDWAEYQAIGRIRALPLTDQWLQALQLPEAFEFIAAWGSPMKAQKGDFLASPEDFSEVYRIAQAEFWETYAPLD